jgi:cell division septation protein DedD
MSDEGFHEIQLNGKQLVFLFMAATVVSVVIFLCGVLVGRGVRTGDSQAAVADIGPIASDAVVAPPAETLPLAGEPPAAVPSAEELSYPDRLQGNAPPEETLKTAPESAPPAVAADVPSQPEPTSAPADPVAAPTSAENSGFVVQVAALRDQKDADLIAKRLIEKGYPAYVLAPAKNAPAPVYRVQVGKFSNLREAEETGARLEKEERFKPWIRR